MAWFGVSVVLGIRVKSGQQVVVPAWENVYLIEADDSEAAREEAVKIGREHVEREDESFSWNDRPSVWVFAGVRKVTPLRSSHADDGPAHGAEISYSEFEVASFEDLERLGKGKSVSVTYVE